MTDTTNEFIDVPLAFVLLGTKKNENDIIELADINDGARNIHVDVSNAAAFCATLPQKYEDVRIEGVGRNENGVFLVSEDGMRFRVSDTESSDFDEAFSKEILRFTRLDETGNFCEEYDIKEINDGPAASFGV